MSLRSLTADLVAFREARGWGRHHTPKNLCMAISSEAGELCHLYRWEGDGQARIFEADEARGEIADILIFTLYLCHALGIEPEAAIRDKMKANAERYPAP